MRTAAINTHTDFHQLDHIAPLCEWLDIPLLITEELNDQLAKKYYPMVKSYHSPDIEFHLADLARDFETLIECKAWNLDLKWVFREIHKKEMRLIYCPHGQSDKGYKAPSLEHFATHDAALVYGELLDQMLEEMKIKAKTIRVGNYRYPFYKKYKSFYDDLAEEEIFSKLPKQKTVLYAPTWNDLDQATSFFELAPILAEKFPEDWNLIVKVHPYLEDRDPAKYYRTAKLFENKRNQILVERFPPIYPILARTDVYLGDYSSVGYDFLAFRRPMFFLLQKDLPKGRLHSCGHEVKNIEEFIQRMERPNTLQKNQEALFTKAFGKTPPKAKEIKSQITLQEEEEHATSAAD
jgi:CDP-glycerol glycerophosphotransferase (TagB/SpsB family)